MIVAAILCPGPSLERYRQAGMPYDVVIAVNKACLFAPHHWFVAHDRETFDMFPAAPMRGICTHGAIIDEYRAGGLTRLPRDLEGIPLMDLPQVGWNYRNASMFGAMALAAHLGAEQADLFGVDWSGASNWDGTVQAEGRPAERWQLEAAAYERLKEALPQTRFLRMVAIT